MTIETKELIISKELKRRIEFICKFANVNYTLTNGNIKSIKNTNIAYVEPHTLRINNTLFLFFNETERVYINNLSKCIPLSNLKDYILKLLTNKK